MASYKHAYFKESDYLDLRVVQIGEEFCVPNHSYGPAKRDNYLIHMILSGNGYYIYENYNGVEKKKFNLSKGEGFLITPGRIHQYQANSDDPWHYMWIEFNGMKVGRLLDECGFSDTNLIYRPEAITNNALRYAIRHLYKIINDSNMPYQGLLGYTYLFFTELALNAEKKKKQSSKFDLKNLYIEKAVHYIQNNFSSIVELDEIAIYCHLNKNYLNKLFKENLNTTLQDYLINYRLKIAIELLQSYDLPISEISLKCGYTSSFNFYRAFKQKFNIPPSQWRKFNKI